MYNLMSEICFKHCIDNFNSRTLDPNEAYCVESCAAKFINYNHRMMNDFVKRQTDIVNKRIGQVTAEDALPASS